MEQKDSSDKIIAHLSMFWNGSSFKPAHILLSRGAGQIIKNRRQTAVSISASCPSKRLRG